MEKRQHSMRFLRRRKFMLVLPLLVVPFLTMAFWALGGGCGHEQSKVEGNRGLNMQLPDAKLKDEQLFDKLSFYKAADADSLKRAELLRNDPYYKDSLAYRQDSKLLMPVDHGGLNVSPYSGSGNGQEQQIYQKINELNQQLNAPAVAPSVVVPQQGNGSIRADVERLQGMMQVVNGPQEDTEMQEINGTLEKILDIQHPDRVKEKLREQSLQHKQQVFTVNAEQQVRPADFFGDTVRSKRNGFYDEQGKVTALHGGVANAVSAVVHGSQTVSNGSTVKLRLLHDVFINGLLVPKGSFVFGNASLDNERLLISIPHVRYGNNLLPVALSVYDLDGLAGIHIPGSINRDVAKQSADQGLQSVGLLALDPSLKAQATAVGVGAAKSLLSRKVKLIKVTLKAGYQLLLKDENQQNF